MKPQSVNMQLQMEVETSSGIGDLRNKKIHSLHHSDRTNTN